MKKFYFTSVTRFFDISRALGAARNSLREVRFLNSVTPTSFYADSVAYFSGSVQDWRARRREVFATFAPSL